MFNVHVYNVRFDFVMIFLLPEFKCRQYSSVSHSLSKSKIWNSDIFNASFFSGWNGGRFIVQSRKYSIRKKFADLRLFSSFQPQFCFQILTSLVGAVSIPITCKIRILPQVRLQVTRTNSKKYAVRFS